MQLTVLGSGSSGNCYLIHNETECLILDAGIPSIDVQRALDYNIQNIVGVLVTHAHGDHAKYAKDFAKMGIPVIKPYEKPIDTITLGNFKIQPFGVEHDVPCFGFMVKHEEIGKLIYITDTTHVVHKFSQLNHMLIEANYDKTLIDDTQANATHVRQGHMEIGETIKFVKANNCNSLRNVVLVHLSNANSNEQQFIDAIQKCVNCDVYAADKGLQIRLSKYPF